MSWATFSNNSTNTNFPNSTTEALLDPNATFSENDDGENENLVAILFELRSEYEISIKLAAEIKEHADGNFEKAVDSFEKLINRLQSYVDQAKMVIYNKDLLQLLYLSNRNLGNILTSKGTKLRDKTDEIVIPKKYYHQALLAGFQTIHFMQLLGIKDYNYLIQFGFICLKAGDLETCRHILNIEINNGLVLISAWKSLKSAYELAVSALVCDELPERKELRCIIHSITLDSIASPASSAFSERIDLLSKLLYLVESNNTLDCSDKLRLTTPSRFVESTNSGNTRVGVEMDMQVEDSEPKIAEDSVIMNEQVSETSPSIDASDVNGNFTISTRDDNEATNDSPKDVIVSNGRSLRRNSIRVSSSTNDCSDESLATGTNRIFKQILSYCGIQCCLEQVQKSNAAHASHDSTFTNDASDGLVDRNCKDQFSLSVDDLQSWPSEVAKDAALKIEARLSTTVESDGLEIDGLNCFVGLNGLISLLETRIDYRCSTVTTEIHSTSGSFEGLLHNDSHGHKLSEDELTLTTSLALMDELFTRFNYGELVTLAECSQIVVSSLASLIASLIRNGAISHMFTVPEAISHCLQSYNGTILKFYQLTTWYQEPYRLQDWKSLPSVELIILVESAVACLVLYRAVQRSDLAPAQMELIEFASNILRLTIPYLMDTVTDYVSDIGSGGDEISSLDLDQALLFCRQLWVVLLFLVETDSARPDSHINAAVVSDELNSDFVQFIASDEVLAICLKPFEFVKIIVLPHVDQSLAEIDSTRVQSTIQRLARNNELRLLGIQGTASTSDDRWLEDIRNICADSERLTLMIELAASTFCPSSDKMPTLVILAAIQQAANSNRFDVTLELAMKLCCHIAALLTNPNSNKLHFAVNCMESMSISLDSLKHALPYFAQNDQETYSLDKLMLAVLNLFGISVKLSNPRLCNAASNLYLACLAIDNNDASIRIGVWATVAIVIGIGSLVNYERLTDRKSSHLPLVHAVISFARILLVKEKLMLALLTNGECSVLTLWLILLLGKNDEYAQLVVDPFSTDSMIVQSIALSLYSLLIGCSICPLLQQNSLDSKSDLYIEMSNDRRTAISQYFHDTDQWGVDDVDRRLEIFILCHKAMYSGGHYQLDCGLTGSWQFHLLWSYYIYQGKASSDSTNPRFSFLLQRQLLLCIGDLAYHLFGIPLYAPIRLTNSEEGNAYPSVAAYASGFSSDSLQGMDRGYLTTSQVTLPNDNSLGMDISARDLKSLFQFIRECDCWRGGGIGSLSKSDIRLSLLKLLPVESALNQDAVSDKCVRYLCSGEQTSDADLTKLLESCPSPQCSMTDVCSYLASHTNKFTNVQVSDPNNEINSLAGSDLASVKKRLSYVMTMCMNCLNINSNSAQCWLILFTSVADELNFLCDEFVEMVPLHSLPSSIVSRVIYSTHGDAWMAAISNNSTESIERGISLLQTVVSQQLANTVAEFLDVCHDSFFGLNKGRTAAQTVGPTQISTADMGSEGYQPATDSEPSAIDPRNLHGPHPSSEPRNELSRVRSVDPSGFCMSNDLKSSHFDDTASTRSLIACILQNSRSSASFGQFVAKICDMIAMKNCLMQILARSATAITRLSQCCQVLTLPEHGFVSTLDLTSVYLTAGLQWYSTACQYQKGSIDKFEALDTALKFFRSAVDNEKEIILDSSTSRQATMTASYVPFARYMLGKLQYQRTREIAPALHQLVEADQSINKGSLKTDAGLKSLRTQIFYQLHSLRAKHSLLLLSQVERVSSSPVFALMKQGWQEELHILESTSFTPSHSITPVGGNVASQFVFQAIESLDVSDEPFRGSESTAGVGPLDSVLDLSRRLWMVLLNAILGLRECRRVDQYEAFSVHRIADIIYSLYKDWHRPEQMLPNWVREGLQLLGITEVSPFSSLLEQRKLFDKKRTHVVAIWCVDTPLNIYDKILKRTHKFDKLRLKYFDRYSLYADMSVRFITRSAPFEPALSSTNQPAIVTISTCFDILSDLALWTRSVKRLTVTITAMIYRADEAIHRACTSCLRFAEETSDNISDEEESDSRSVAKEILAAAFKFYNNVSKRVSAAQKAMIEKVIVALFLVANIWPTIDSPNESGVSTTSPGDISQFSNPLDWILFVCKGTFGVATAISNSKRKRKRIDGADDVIVHDQPAADIVPEVSNDVAMEITEHFIAPNDDMNLPAY